MDSDLKAIALDPLPEFRRGRVIAFGNEIERRAESHFAFKVHHLLALVQPGNALDIMGEDKGEPLPFRPALPAGRWRLGAVLDRSEEHTSELQSLRHLVC